MSTEASTELEVKSLGVLEIKDSEKGEVEAIIATLGVVDRDMDVIKAGAFEDGARVRLSAYGHGAMYGEMPVGRGALHIEGNKAVFRGKLFMSTTRGREAFDVLKEMGKDQDWSFGYRVMGWEVPDDEWRGKGAERILTKLDAFEVSPVLVGAGLGTRTVAVKAADTVTMENVTVVAEAPPEETTRVDDAEEKARLLEELIAQAAEDAKAAEMKARSESALEEFHRVQRTLKRLRVV